MQKFKVLAGKHQHYNKKAYKKGDIIKSDLPLDTMFRNKFERVGGTATEAPPLRIRKKTKKQKAVAGLGKPIDMPLAAEHDLLVFRKNKKYHVYEKGSTTPLNEEALNSKLGKGGVLAFIKAHLEE